jgi:hypothetical protein
MSEIPELTEVEKLTKLVNELFVAMAASFDDKLKKIEDLMESYEKQIATLVVGFGEQAVFIEALLGQIQFSTEDAQKAFMETLNNSRKQMLQIMKDGARDLVANENERLASSIEDVVESKSSESSS